MRLPGVPFPTSALWQPLLLVTLGSSLGACAVASDPDGSDMAADMVEGGGMAGESPEPGEGGSGTNVGDPATGGTGGTASDPAPAGAAGTVDDGFGAAGAGGADPVDWGAAGQGGTAPPPPPPPPEAANVTCSPIVNGTSTVSVDGVTRFVSVQMPADTSHMALLFLWHGWMQMPDTFRNEVVYDVPSGQWVPFDPNAFPMPLMIVTPHDLKLLPPAGLDWDIVSGAQDFPFFEGMLQCIKDQYAIDESRIYSFGFSAGAVFTNLLSARYPDLFAATISESGAWFNDQTQWSDVSIPIMQWQWPDFDPADGGNVLLTHGGPQDYATVISLESTNQKALPFLYGNGRTVTQCSHTFGHTLDPDLTQRMYYDYLWAHQRGGPPLAGLPPGFPTQQNPVGATACTFHPAP